MKNPRPASAVGLRPLLVDAKQAARLLGIGQTTLHELIKAGEDLEGSSVSLWPPRID